METTIALCIECAKALALTAFPIIPETCMRIWKLIGSETDLTKAVWGDELAQEVPSGQSLPQPEILFRKVEDAEIDAEVEKLHAMLKENQPKENSQHEPLKDLIDFNDFQKLDLRVGEVVEAESVPKSKKLLKLAVDLGFERRTVVSGISQFYNADDLIGRKVIVVANLKPAKLMGIQSEGMILAGSNEKSLELVGLNDLPVGSVVS